MANQNLCLPIDYSSTFLDFSAGNIGYQLRRARLLDVPFIFNLIQDGSSSGVFSNEYLTPKGCATLFKSLICDNAFILNPTKIPISFQQKSSIYLLIENDQDTLGFVQLGSDSICPNKIFIEKFSIAPKFRKQGYGRKMLQSIVELLRTRYSLIAYCTPQAKVMKHLLKTTRFERQKQSIVPFGCRGLDAYELPAKS